MNRSYPESSAHGIFQARILEWIVMPSFSYSLHEVKGSEFAQSCLTLCDPMDCSPPTPPSMGFSRQEYWSGLPFPSPGDLPDPGIEPRSPTSRADALTSEPPGKPSHMSIIFSITYCLLLQVYWSSSMFEVYNMMIGYVYSLWKDSSLN